MLGLPDTIRACLFDLDGVLTKTAVVHAEAWRTVFDGFLRTRAESTGEPFRAFDVPADYEAYVDGKPRLEGVRSFLRARRIELAEGSADDPPGENTLCALATRKDDLVRDVMRRQGVEAYEGSIRYVEAARARGLRCAVVSSSMSCREVLQAAGIAHLFDVVVDGKVAQRERLAGKPAPDTFLAAARKLQVAPGESAVFEDAVAGVEAGRAGGFGFVVGVDRTGHAEELRRHGADVVVTDLAALLSDR
jgi:beta-phosphoglucomutase family hydrolase